MLIGARTELLATEILTLASMSTGSVERARSTDGQTRSTVVRVSRTRRKGRRTVEMVECHARVVGDHSLDAEANAEVEVRGRVHGPHVQPASSAVEPLPDPLVNAQELDAGASHPTRTEDAGG